MVNKVFIDPLTGNVGIGSGVPTSSLDVGGEVGMKLVLTDAPFPSAASYSTYFTPDYADAVDSIDAATNREYPPTAMTAPTSRLFNSIYGIGTYIASASSEYSASYPAWIVFNKVGTTANGYWASSESYSSTTGAYTRSPPSATYTTSGTSYLGEWLQIQLPSAIMLMSYSITEGTGTYRPISWWFLGSSNGANWELLDTRTNMSGGWTDNVARSFTPPTLTTSLYTYFRIVISTIIIGFGHPEITEFAVFGNNTSKYPIWKRTLTSSAGVYDVGQSTIYTNTMANISSSNESVPSSLFDAWNSNVGLHRWSTSLATYTNATDASIIPCVTIKFPKPIVISSYALTANATITETPSKWNLYGSNLSTNAGWSLVNAQASVTNWTAYEKKVLSVANATLYCDAYKIDFLRNNSSTGAAITLGDLRFTASTSVTPFKVESTSFGGVGIGTLYPTAQLDVLGNVKITGNLTCYGNVGKVMALPYDNGVVAAYWFSQVIGVDGQVYHAGNTSGLIGGYGLTPVDSGTPRRVSLPSGENAKVLAVGHISSFVLTKSNKIFSWGKNQSGSLGLGIADGNVGLPTQLNTVADPILYVQTTGSQIGADANSAVSTGYITSTGRLFVWGRNGDGQLGIGDVADRTIPTEVQKISGQNWGGFYLGLYCMFAWTDVVSGSKLYVAGENLTGHLGVGDVTQRESLTPVIRAIDNAQITLVMKIRSSSYWTGTGMITVVLTTTGDLYTCGFNGYGQLGIGSTTNQSKMQGPILTNVRDFDIMRSSGTVNGVMACKNDGTLWAWGYNDSACFGSTAFTNNTAYNSPVQIPGMYDVVRIYGGKQPSYGAVFIYRADGSIWFAGSSYSAAAGLDDGVTYSSFTKVPTPEPIVDLRIFNRYNATYGDSAWTLWLGESGRLYGCGFNLYGTLGTGDKEYKCGLHPAFTSIC